MSGSGSVEVVNRSTEPRSNTSAQQVIVDAGDKRVEFYIPLGPAPQAGDPISWGPHHAWFGGQTVKKLTWEETL